MPESGTSDHFQNQPNERLHIPGKKKRDIEKTCTTEEFVAKLRRLADALEKEKNFRIQIAGEKVYVPAGAAFNIEYEREGLSEEIEFQIKWKNEPAKKRSEKR